ARSCRCGGDEGMKLALSKIVELVGASAEFDPSAVATGYSIDSRTIRSGDLFFAVRGERMDGHDFVAQALEKGAVGAVVTKEWLSSPAGQALTHGRPGSSLMRVEDTLEALQLLGKGVRKLWARTLIGVTGSAGKTTTKEAIAHVLSAKYHV